MRKEIIFLAILFGVFLSFLCLDSVFAYCPTPVDGQDYYVTSSCIFDWNVNGVENGNIIVEAGVTLTIGGIAGGQTIVFNPGYSFINRGSVALNKTQGYVGQISKAYIWYRDSDGDTYRDYYVTTDPTNPPLPGAVRRYTTPTLAGSDCNDGNSNIFQSIASLVTDADHEGYSTGTAAIQCVGVATTTAGRTYYRDSAGNYTWLPSGSSLGTDYDDNNDCIDTVTHECCDDTNPTDGDRPPKAAGDLYFNSACKECDGTSIDAVILTGYSEDSTGTYLCNATCYGCDNGSCVAIFGDDATGTYQCKCTTPGAKGRYCDGAGHCNLIVCEL